MTTWFSVSNKLPEEDSRVLINCAEAIGKVQYVGFLSEGEWWSDDCPLMDVTHWTLLPEPPESM